MKLSIIIPVYNEVKTVEETIKRVFLAPTKGYEKEVIVVNDGSDDGTEKLLENLREKFGFFLLHHQNNRGKGAAIRTAIRKTSGDAVIIQDADLEYDPNDYQKLLNALGQDSPIVYGSRNLKKNKRKGVILYFLGGKLLTVLCNFLFGSHLTDVYTCYKLFRSDIIKNIASESNGFELEMEITAKVLKAGHRIKEVPINYFPRKPSQGKKIKFRDGIISLWTLVKHRIK